MSETAAPTPADEDEDGDGDGYSTALGAFPYAFVRTDSRLCKAYVVVGTLLAAVGTLVFLFAFVTLLGNISGTPAGILTFQPALYLLVWLFVVGPMVAPILLVARRHRRGVGSTSYDRSLAGAGVVFLVSLYLGLVASIPESFVLDGETVARGEPSGLFGPVIAVLYAIPEQYAVVIPLVAALGVYLTHRLRR